MDRKRVKPEVWVKNPSPSRMRDNSKYLGFFDPVEVAECLAEGTRLQPWEYRAYMEDPDTPRRIYVGDDNLMQESELGKHTREEDSTFEAYSSQEFLDANDDPEDGRELEYTMDTGMVSPEKSQSGFIPSYVYRTVYRDQKVLMGFESRRVEKTYLEEERKWVFYSPAGKFIMTTKKVVRTTSYRDDVPIFKWVRIPTLRRIGCLLNLGKVVGSSTVVTRKERRFGFDKREVERQAHRHDRVLMRQDEIDARRQVVPAAG
jgi:hypothetical protein